MFADYRVQRSRSRVYKFVCFGLGSSAEPQELLPHTLLSLEKKQVRGFRICVGKGRLYLLSAFRAMGSCSKQSFPYNGNQ